LTGDGTNAGSGRESSAAQMIAKYGQVAASATANTFSNVEIYIPNYNSSTNKPASAIVAHENNNSAAYTSANALLRSVTDAITSVSLVSASGNFVANSTFWLYGIKNS
jgi:hypothetical protein